LSAAKLPDTTRSRCFQIQLQKKLPSEKVEKLTRKFDGSMLRRKCLRWANDHREKLKTAEPAMPRGLSARQEDISEALLAIADACGSTWPDTVRQCIQSYCITGDHEGSLGSELLRDVQSAFAGCGRITSEKLKEFFTAIP